jgi:hypothetical protein
VSGSLQAFTKGSRRTFASALQLAECTDPSKTAELRDQIASESLPEQSRQHWLKRITIDPSGWRRSRGSSSGTANRASVPRAVPKRASISRGEINPRSTPSRAPTPSRCRVLALLVDDLVDREADTDATSTPAVGGAHFDYPR